MRRVWRGGEGGEGQRRVASIGAVLEPLDHASATPAARARGAAAWIVCPAAGCRLDATRFASLSSRNSPARCAGVSSPCAPRSTSGMPTATSTSCAGEAGFFSSAAGSGAAAVGGGAGGGGSAGMGGMGGGAAAAGRCHATSPVFAFQKYLKRDAKC